MEYFSRHGRGVVGVKNKGVETGFPHKLVSIPIVHFYVRGNKRTLKKGSVEVLIGSV